MTVALPNVVHRYQALMKLIPLRIPRNPREYKKLVAVLDDIIDVIGSHERHPLADLADVLGTLIEAYEDKRHPWRPGDTVAVLKALMQEHGLKQTDLALEFGGQSVASAVLSRKRALNIRQINALAKRFHLDPAVFL